MVSFAVGKYLIGIQVFCRRVYPSAPKRPLPYCAAMGSPSSHHAARRLERRAPAPERRIRSTQEMLAQRAGPGTATIIGRTLLGLLALLLLLGALLLVAMALDPDSEPDRAPWAGPSAPDVAPPALAPQ